MNVEELKKAIEQEQKCVQDIESGLEQARDLLAVLGCFNERTVTMMDRLRKEMQLAKQDGELFDERGEQHRELMSSAIHCNAALIALLMRIIRREKRAIAGLESELEAMTGVPR